MEKQYEKEFTWTIKNFSFQHSEEIYSDEFVIGDSRWRLSAYPKGHSDGINTCLSLFLSVADFEYLPDGWKRHTKIRLIVVNQVSDNLSVHKEYQHWFNKLSPKFGFSKMLTLTKLLDHNSGFMVNGEIKIVAEVGVLEVIEKSDVDVHGFRVPPSQVKSVNNLFEKHPDIASECDLENSQLRTAYLNSLLSLTEILSQSLEELSFDDLASVCCTITCFKKAGFKLDWLEKKVVEAGQTRLQKIEKQSCTGRDSLLDFLG